MLENEQIQHIVAASVTEDNKLIGVINQKAEFNIYNVYS